MMKKLAAVAALLLTCAAGVCAEDQPKDELKAAPAAEAQSIADQTRDFLTNLLWEATDAYWHEGQWDECIRLCKQIVQLDPHFVEAYTGAAWMLWNLDRDDEAIAMFNEGIAANPDAFEIYHEFGMYYAQRKQYAKAVEQFRKSVEHNAPMHFQHMLPNTLEKMDRKEEALAEWRAILKRFPDDPIAKMHIEGLERALEAERQEKGTAG